MEFISCHQKPERSFFFKGQQFPICARCTGLYLGFLSFPFFTFGWFELSWIISVLLILPTVLDGLIQAYLTVESNNIRRFVTGTIAGVGCMSLSAIIGQYIGNQIVLIFNQLFYG